jgi:hypothetical protein
MVFSGFLGGGEGFFPECVVTIHAIDASRVHWKHRYFPLDEGVRHGDNVCMFLRIVKVAGSSGTVHEYVRVVTSVREHGKVRQKVIANLGR